MTRQKAQLKDNECNENTQHEHLRITREERERKNISNGYCRHRGSCNVWRALLTQHLVESTQQKCVFFPQSKRDG